MSKQRKFRSKLSFEDDEEDQDGSTAKAAASKPVKAPSKPSLLSFGEDEEQAGAVTKKKSKVKVSKFHQAGAAKGASSDAAGQATHRPAAGEYSAERLKELQKNTLKLSAPPQQPAAQQPAEGIIRLSGSLKPVRAPKDDRFLDPSPAALVPPPAHLAQEDGEDEDMPLPPPPRPGAGNRPGAGAMKPGSAAQQVQEAEEEEEEDGFQVPDSKMIKLAKAKRERLRQAHLAPDYIPLGGATRLLASGSSAAGDAGGFKTAEDALGSGSDEEQEEQMRLQFMGKKDAKADKANGASKYSTLVDDTGDGEEDFAEEQLRKAIRRNAGRSASTSAAAAGPVAAVAGSGGYGSEFGAPAAAPGALLASSRARQHKIQEAGDAVVASIQDALRRLQTSHKQTKGNVDRTVANLNGALQGIERLQTDIALAGEKFAYVQVMKGYVADLCDCLAEKAPLVEELEEALQQLQEEHTQALRQQADADAQALLRQGEAAVAAALGIIGRGGSADAASAAAEAAAKAVIEQQEREMGEAGGAEEEEVDEFGRSTNWQRKREAAAAVVRRAALLEEQRRRLQRMAEGVPLDLDAPDLPAGAEAGVAAEAARYESRRQEALEAASTVFADADEEYASLVAVKGRLEQWKQRYPKEYNTAYVSLSAPALFAPFARLELLQWDPLGAGTGFDAQEWYSQLFDYGAGPTQNGHAAVAADDPDANLVPHLVESLVLPRALHAITHCWDPFSVAQSKAVAALVGDMLVYVPAEQEGLQIMLKQVTGALERATAGATVPAWPAAAVAAGGGAEGALLLRFVRAARLLRGLMAFRELLDRPLLNRLGLQQLLGMQLLPYVRAAAGGAMAAAASSSGSSSSSALAVAVACAEAVVLSLPREWFLEGVCPNEAIPLRELLTGVAMSMEAGARSASAAGGTAGVSALAQRLAPLLAHMGVAERAVRLGQAFGFGPRQS